MDSDEERQQFQQQFDLKLDGIPRKRVEFKPLQIEPNQNPEQQFNHIVTDILNQKRRGKSIKVGSETNQPVTQQRKVRRTKWTPEANELFYKLFKSLNGDLDMICEYFLQETNTKFTKKSIKQQKKYNLELKTNPDRLKVSKKRLDEKSREKISKVAQYITRQHSVPSNELEPLEPQHALMKNDSATSWDFNDEKINNYKIDRFNKMVEQINARRLAQ